MLPTSSFVRAAQLHHQEVFAEAVRERGIEAAVRGQPTPGKIRPMLWAIPLAIVVVIAVAVAMSLGDPTGAIRAVASSP